jgi:Abnormal spindle-like microcephaly-assoc'd, ASPM-SPD-2-Hydin
MLKKKYILALLAASISASALAGNFVRMPSPIVIGVLSSHPAVANLPQGGAGGGAGPVNPGGPQEGPGPTKPDPVGKGSLEGVDFGSVTAGTRLVRSAVLRNTGDGPLAGISTYVQGAGFSLAGTTCGSILAAGSACDIEVAVVAEGMSAHGGSVVVNTSVGELNAALSAQSLKGELSGSAASRAFGNVQVGQSATSAAITLTNSGNYAVTGVSFAPPAGYSVAASNCGSILGAGASCSFAVRFAPTAEQAYPGTLKITSNNGGAHDIVLTGAGLGSMLSASDFVPGVSGTKKALRNNSGSGVVITNCLRTQPNGSVVPCTAKDSWPLTLPAGVSLVTEFPDNIIRVYVGTGQVVVWNPTTATVTME